MAIWLIMYLSNRMGGVIEAPILATQGTIIQTEQDVKQWTEWTQQTANAL